MRKILSNLLILSVLSLSSTSWGALKFLEDDIDVFLGNTGYDKNEVRYEVAPENTAGMPLTEFHLELHSNVRMKSCSVHIDGKAITLKPEGTQENYCQYKVTLGEKDIEYQFSFRSSKKDGYTTPSYSLKFSQYPAFEDGISAARHYDGDKFRSYRVVILLNASLKKHAKYPGHLVKKGFMKGFEQKLSSSKVLKNKVGVRKAQILKILSGTANSNSYQQGNALGMKLAGGDVSEFQAYTSIQLSVADTKSNALAFKAGFIEGLRDSQGTDIYVQAEATYDALAR